MATISRIRAVWTGFPGGPGVNTFYSLAEDPVASPAQLRTFYDSIKALLATGVTITVDGSGDTLNDATGEINGSWSVTPAPTPVVSTGVGAYAAPVGAVVIWGTAAIINGRRLKGKTFLVPLDGGQFDDDGALLATARTTLQTAADTLNTGTNALAVWHRPTKDIGTDGTSSAVSTASVPELAAVLRSRRD